MNIERHVIRKPATHICFADLFFLIVMLYSCRADRQGTPVSPSEGPAKEALEIVSQCLDSIYDRDQQDRAMFMERIWAHDTVSRAYHNLVTSIHRTDSLNLVKVRSILNQYGWLGPEQIGNKANDAIFLVVQHADKNTRKFYLPLIRLAVQAKKALPDQLALLEDRTAIDEGRPQIYGSQIRRNSKTNTFYLMPLLDPEHVDQRRRNVGLGPLSEYLDIWGIQWPAP